MYNFITVFHASKVEIVENKQSLISIKVVNDSFRLLKIDISFKYSQLISFVQLERSKLS